MICLMVKIRADRYLYLRDTVFTGRGQSYHSLMSDGLGS